MANYRMNLDGGGYLLLAHDFPEHYFRGNVTFLSRPLYPVLVNLAAKPLHLFSNSYTLTFAAGIAVNFTLFFFSVWLFYLILKRLFSFRVAFLSSLLLILSPFAHVWLVQPETNVFGIFALVLSLYLLLNWQSRPSLKKLIIFSLIVGVLMLGKKLFVIAIIVLLLAIYFKRYKEGIIFLFLYLIPTGLWYLFVTKVWGLTFYVDELNYYGLQWHQLARIFLNSLPYYFSSVIYGFLLFPLFFSVLGFRKIIEKNKRAICFILILSFFFFSLLTNQYSARYGFLLFPLVLPLAVLGIDAAVEFLRAHKNWPALIFYSVLYIFLIVISNINVFKIFQYDIRYPWSQ